jgi:hypothetical protein
MDYTLRPYPKYGDNKIEKEIVFDTDKTSATFGQAYYHTKHHKVQDRNKFLYKLVDDLRTDDYECASRDSSSAYSALSYTSNFDEYYWSMPVQFKEVNEDVPVPKSNPPKNYGFVKHNPPFEQRIHYTRYCGAMLREANARLLPVERKVARQQKQQEEDSKALVSSAQIKHAKHKEV